MPLLAYTPTDASGRTVKSALDPDNEQLVLAKRRDMSLHCTGNQKAATASSKGIGRNTFKPKSVVVFSRQFATMIDAGIPILCRLDILTGQQKDPVLKEALEQITNEVRGGLTLNEA